MNAMSISEALAILRGCSYVLPAIGQAALRTLIDDSWRMQTRLQGIDSKLEPMRHWRVVNDNYDVLQESTSQPPAPAVGKLQRLYTVVITEWRDCEHSHANS